MSQLNLFRGKRQRGRKPPAPPEEDLQIAVAQVLDRWISKGWIFTHIPLGGSRGRGLDAIITGRRLKRMGTKRGWPDFILLAPLREIEDRSGEGTAGYVGQAHFLELKREGEELSDEQVAFYQFCTANGYPWAKADSFDQALVALRAWGAVRVKP